MLTRESPRWLGTFAAVLARKGRNPYPGEWRTLKSTPTNAKACRWMRGIGHRGHGRKESVAHRFRGRGESFAVGRVFSSDGGGHLTAKDISRSFHELWEPCFGLPELVRADPTRCVVRKNLMLIMTLWAWRLRISRLMLIGNLGSWNAPSNGRKKFMSKAFADHPEWSSDVWLAQAIRTWNQRELVRGYSPFQWMFAKAPDFEERMFVPDVHRVPGSLLCHPEGGFHCSEELRLSEQAFVDWQYQETLSRARIKLQGEHARPGSSVWLVRGMRPSKASIEQLRMASEREILLHELSQQVEAYLWTTQRLSEELGPYNSEDVSSEKPLKD